MFHDLITKRQSVRKYKPTAVSYESLMQCVEAARLAPSAVNAQPWKFVVVDDPALKSQVGAAAASMGMNKFCEQAAAIVAVVQERPTLLSKIGSVLQGKDYTLIDIGIATEHFCLQATELGLGTCIVGMFNEKKVKELLGVPKSKRVPLLVTVGYADDTPRKKTRKTQAEMSARNKYVNLQKESE